MLADYYLYGGRNCAVYTLRDFATAMDQLSSLYARLSELLSSSSVLDRNKLSRSVLILVCGMMLFNLPTLLYKVRLYLKGILYFLFCWDKSFKKPNDPGSFFGPHISKGLPTERKTIYFVRHGESTWNDTFNKGSTDRWRCS